ncbi:hypothetical protein GR927_27535 [Mycolicibacterium sp. 3033]|nr:hypothetical protein [Mycolicibacterium aurantiacum]
MLCACSGPTVINTDERTTTTAAPPAAPSTTVASNAHLVNAFDYAAQVDGRTGYYFTSPSGRWQCAIKPRVEAGCQNADAPASAIRITDAPDDVPGPDGEPAAPNAIRVDRDRAAEFAVVPATAYGLEPDPAEVLPFNRILAVAGFRCNVQEASGISCLSETSGAGFTFSAEEYAMSYVDVPPDAP